ncbi:beta-hexosaminidase [Bacteroides pyogenes JCM 6292]|uniref:Beta-hexosaminidase n=1 Tax=Bacteroides pyogenes JCM 6292 TaxID=1235809 RepID=W4P3M6_9BACE|nr:beta-hexosaminidase [Bacteroides pyogenes JCM 6292]
MAIAGLAVSCQSVQKEADYRIIPLPQEIATAQGNPFVLKSGVKILYPEGTKRCNAMRSFWRVT